MDDRLQDVRTKGNDFRRGSIDKDRAADSERDEETFSNVLSSHWEMNEFSKVQSRFSHFVGRSFSAKDRKNETVVLLVLTNGEDRFDFLSGSSGIFRHEKI